MVHDLSKTNSDGFSWASVNRTSIVTQDITDGAVVVYPNNIIVGPSRNWTSKDQDYSLRFRYPAGEAMAEQRFTLGAPRNELWIRYWIRVPVNFSFESGGTPNKFFSIWFDGYEGAGDGSTVWLCMEKFNTNSASLWFTYTIGNYTGSTAPKQTTPFIDVPADRERWMQIVFHVKAESSPGAGDGIIETYRRWDGDTSFSKLHEMLNAPLKIATAGPNGFSAGYIMGWANAAYSTDTEWLLDDFTISDTSLLDVVIAPNAPTRVRVISSE